MNMRKLQRELAKTAKRQAEKEITKLAEANCRRTNHDVLARMFVRRLSKSDRRLFANCEKDSIKLDAEIQRQDKLEREWKEKGMKRHD